MQSKTFLAANQRNRQTKMKFWEVGAPLWAVKHELLNKRIATRDSDIFVVLRGLQVKEFTQVGGTTFKRVCPEWETIRIPSGNLNDLGKQIRADYLAMPVVDGVIFR